MSSHPRCLVRPLVQRVLRLSRGLGLHRPNDLPPATPSLPRATPLAGLIARRVVESRPGAALYVERLELTAEGRRLLSVGVPSLPGVPEAVRRYQSH